MKMTVKKRIGKLSRDISNLIEPLYKKARECGLEQCPKCTMFCPPIGVVRKDSKIYMEYYCKDCEKSFYRKMNKLIKDDRKYR